MPWPMDDFVTWTLWWDGSALKCPDCASDHADLIYVLFCVWIGIAVVSHSISMCNWRHPFLNVALDFTTLVNICFWVWIHWMFCYLVFQHWVCYCLKLFKKFKVSPLFKSVQWTLWGPVLFNLFLFSINLVSAIFCHFNTCLSLVLKG